MKSANRTATDNAARAAIAMSVVRGILHATESIGLPSDTLCKEAGFDCDGVGDGRITGTQFIALWEAIARLSHDPYCGLHIGEKTKPTSAHLVGHLLMNCTTVGEALETYSRYQRIVSNLLVVSMEKGQRDFCLTLQGLDYALSNNRQLVEWVMAGESALLQELAQRPVKPLKVWFTHAAPRDISEYLRVFKSPVLFGRPVNALVLSAVDLNIPIRQADPELFSIFDHQAQQYLKSLDNATCYAERVRRVLIPTIKNGRPNINRVSAALNMSTRTLQLKLTTEGTSFQEILENIRKELALSYLQDARATASEVGCLLGFSEPSAFNRAFKRWTGKPPGSYRKDIATPF